MNILVPITMFSWPFVVLVMFALMPLRRAVLLSIFIAWLFLPIATFKVADIPAYSKITAAMIGIILGILIFDLNRLLSLRPRWADIPVVVLCLCPFMSSIENGLGLHDGLSSIIYQTLVWGLPYLIGRIYFADLEALHDLTVAIVLGGLVYVPLCLFEIHFSPQLHHWIYGYFQSPFVMAKRFGGYRPMVFMQTGLAVGLWMVESAIVAIWLWSNESINKVANLSIGAVASILLVTAILCKSLGSLFVLALGLSTLFICRRWKTAIPFFCVVLLIPAYISIRLDKMITPDGVASVMSNVMDKSHVDSFRFRMVNEDILTDLAFKQPIWGWGGWNRFSAKDDEGRATVTDSLWIIAFGKNGMVGLLSLLAMMLVPPMMAWYRFPPRPTSDIRLASLHLLTLLQVLFMLDCLSNAMINPIYILAVGAVNGVLMRPRAQLADLADSKPKQYRPAASFRKSVIKHSPVP